MDLPGLDRQPGRVVEAEILRRFNSSISFDPNLSAHEFFLVVSVGRCKFRLSEVSVALILNSVIGGCPDAFRVYALSDRVFRFSVHLQSVGFHIFRLRSFECSSFKIYFHLWHRGGPNYQHEYKLWQDEQSSQWVDVVKKILSRANLIHVGSSHVLQNLLFIIPSFKILVIMRGNKFSSTFKCWSFLMF
jgi:hypothetical protein